MREISIPIENNWRGAYRLEYDERYVTLFGKDANYKQFNYGGEGTYYEEMVLLPVVAEIKNIKNLRITEYKNYLSIQYDT